MTSKASTRRVWHITDFASLYELTDDVRKERSGPLRYIKSLVTMSPFCPDAETRFHERLCRLRSHRDRYLLRSVLEDLKCWAGAKPYAVRGFVVTAEGKAASYDYLASQLGMPAEDLKKALPILEDIGFLERVPLVKQRESARPKRKKTARKKTSKTTKKTKSKKAKKAASGALEAATEALPERNGPKRPALKKVKAKVKEKIKGKDKATIGLSASGCKRKTNGNGKREDLVNAQKSPSDLCPPAAPPSAAKPKESDDGERVIPFARSPGSVDYSRPGLAYGRRVYLALGYRSDPESPEALREICSFASSHDRICARLAGLGPPAIDAVLARALREASKIARRKSAKRLGACWTSVANKIADARLKEAI